jgi:hypothetical protein
MHNGEGSGNRRILPILRDLNCPRFRRAQRPVLEFLRNVSHRLLDFVFRSVVCH